MHSDNYEMIAIAMELHDRGANVIIKAGQVIIMSDAEFAAHMSQIMAD